jgi:cell division septation protein DedD
MKEEQDDLARSSAHSLTGSNVSDPPKADPEEHFFRAFDEDDDEFEESDRDTDFSLGFREETFDDEDLLDEEQSFNELLPVELEEDQTTLFEEQDTFLKTEAQKVAGTEDADPEELWETSPKYAEIDRDEPWEDDSSIEEADSEETWEAPLSALQQEDIYEENEPEAPWDAENSAQDDLRQPWMAQDEYAGDTMESERWPVSMLAVGTLALLLVIAGVYGVMQQRSATQEEIRQLQASLATAASPEEVAATRVALQEANAQNSQLASNIDGLRLENQRLSDMVSGLEAQLTAQKASQTAAKAVAAKPVASKPVATKPAAENRLPAVQQASTLAGSTTGGNWFVNFGSYSQESAAQAWANKLKPASGQVIVAPITSNGSTLYRVRVINLPGESAARKTAGELQTTHSIPKLWVGQQ